MGLTKGRTKNGKSGKEGGTVEGKREGALGDLGEITTVLSHLRSLNNFTSLRVEGGSGLDVSTPAQGSLQTQYQQSMQLLDQAEQIPLKSRVIPGHPGGPGKMQMQQSHRRPQADVKGAEAQPARSCSERRTAWQKLSKPSVPQSRGSLICGTEDAGELLGVCKTGAGGTARFATYTHTNVRKLIRRFRTSRPVKKGRPGAENRLEAEAAPAGAG